MKNFNEILTTENIYVVNSRLTEREKLELSNSLLEVADALMDSIPTLGTLMFWASQGETNGDNRMPQRDSQDALSNLGYLFQVIPVLYTLFSLLSMKAREK